MKRIFTRTRYFVRRALEAMVRGRRVAVVAIVTIAVAAFVTGGFGAALNAAERLLDGWAGDARISVYLEASADLDAARSAAATIAAGREVEAVTAREALRRFRLALGPDGALLDGVGEGVLPPSVEIRAPGISVAAARVLAARLEAVPGAREVDYGHAWLERLERLVRRVRWAGVALLAALAAGAAVLVANTLRLGVLARRDEIEIMRLVGATSAFVQMPFLIEGAVQGLLGGTLAAIALRAAFGAALPSVASALAIARPLLVRDILPPSLLLALVAGAAALGVVASAIAVAREMGR